jgi:transcriptional regulator with XRE-family HTH domain
MTQPLAIGEKLRDWRQRRRLSQLDLALDAEISARHLSFVETGRSAPSRDMVLRLADRLDVPLRERNALLLAAGYAPAYPALTDPALKPAMEAITLLLKAHEPFPAVAVDRQWNLVAGNAPVRGLMEGVADWLLAPPVNLLRVAIHPEGVGSRIRNYHEWRAHLLHRLRRHFDATGDAAVGALIDELAAYPAPKNAPPTRVAGLDAIAVPLQLETPRGLMSFISTTMVFGAPFDPALAELQIETFLPADEATMAAVRRL